MKKTKKKRIALIDGDGLIHGAKWRNKADTAKYGFIDLEDAIANYERSIKEVLDLTWATDYAIAVKGPNNYRDTFYNEYKKSESRKKSRSEDVAWLPKLKAYAENREGTVVCEGYEADDMLRIWAVEIRERNIANTCEYIICTGDKDLDCIWGKHYRFRRKGSGPILYDVGPRESNLFFWEQVLTGDKVDNIPGIKGVAHKTAMKLFGATYEKGAKGSVIKPPTDSEEEREKIVVKRYANDFGVEEGYLQFLTNCRLLYMWKHYGEHFKYSRERFIALAEKD